MSARFLKWTAASWIIVMIAAGALGERIDTPLIMFTIFAVGGVILAKLEQTP